MNRHEVDEYREQLRARLEEIAIMNAQQNTKLAYIEQSMGEVKDALTAQNGRLRDVEKRTGIIEGFVSVVSVVFSALIGWLFKRGL
jgi:hypothetical protein